jgi:hypothetical protein
MQLVADTDDHDPAARPLSPGGRHVLSGRDAIPAEPDSPAVDMTRRAALVPRPEGLTWETAGQQLAGASPAMTETRADPAGATAGLAGAPADPAGATAGLAGSSLPQRVRQASLAPQLRAQAGGRPAGGDQALRDPEVARAVMSAFHRGWKEGLAAPGVAADPATGRAEEGGQDE